MTRPADLAGNFLLLLLLLNRRTESKSKIMSKSKAESWFMIPMQAEKSRNGALHETYKSRVRARIESDGGPPHSKTLPRWAQAHEPPPGFGVRRPCGALHFRGGFLVTMHGIKVEGAH